MILNQELIKEYTKTLADNGCPPLATYHRASQEIAHAFRIPPAKPEAEHCGVDRASGESETVLSWSDISGHWGPSPLRPIVRKMIYAEWDLTDEDREYLSKNIQIALCHPSRRQLTGAIAVGEDSVFAAREMAEKQRI